MPLVRVLVKAATTEHTTSIADQSIRAFAQLPTRSVALLPFEEVKREKRTSCLRQVDGDAADDMPYPASVGNNGHFVSHTDHDPR